MSVGLLVDCFYYEMGHSDFFHSFFSTVSYHLEKNGWGTEYPLLMRDLYYSELKWSDAEELIHQLEEIRKKLKAYSPNEVIWDIEDITKQPPWGNNISPSITDLSNYFVTSDGRDLINQMIEALKTGIEDKYNIIIRKL